jgi:hypothetical protein
MRWLHDTEYVKTVSFMNAQLNAITPDNVLRYLKLKAKAKQALLNSTRKVFQSSRDQQLSMQ